MAHIKFIFELSKNINDYLVNVPHTRCIPDLMRL